MHRISHKWLFLLPLQTATLPTCRHEKCERECVESVRSLHVKTKQLLTAFISINGCWTCKEPTCAAISVKTATRNQRGGQAYHIMYNMRK